MINKRIIGIVLGTGLILLIPLVAMQFTNEVNWTLFDFVFAGTLLLGTGLTYELVARKASDIVYRAAVGIAVVTALLLVWINGAVGIIGDEGNPANLMYFGVLAVGFIGAIIARLEPRGMARALFAMALAQALVPVIALIIWKPSMEEVPGVFGVFTLNSFFVGLFVLSGFLFRHAARYPQELSNKENKMQVNFMVSNIISWIFGIAFITIGVLNLFLVHPVPGVFYLLLSLVYFPLANVILKKRFGFSIPPAVKIILGLVVLWGTLAVGDLAEIFGL